MSLEIITGKTGEPHIDSEDIGAYNAYTIGKDSYLLNGLDMSITNANTLHVGTGEVLFQGRHVRIKGNGEDVAIANGTTGYKRNDILCLKYQKFPQNSDIESISLELVKGTPTTGTPADPAITTGSILNGDTVVYLKLARIVVNGLTPEAPVKLLSAVKTLAETNKSLADTAQTVAQIGASVDQLFLVRKETITDSITVPSGGYKDARKDITPPNGYIPVAYTSLTPESAHCPISQFRIKKSENSGKYELSVVVRCVDTVSAVLPEIGADVLYVRSSLVQDSRS